jgi:ATP-dependent Clp protease ATP-binding subunit ClpA
LVNAEAILKKRVVGQDHAIKIILDAVFESRSGLNKKGQPMGSFFFLGPTGTGKTELAKALAEFLFQDESAMIRFDMSEFKEEHSVALLYGAPPGYVGYE